MEGLSGIENVFDTDLCRWWLNPFSYLPSALILLYETDTVWNLFAQGEVRNLALNEDCEDFSPPPITYVGNTF